MASKDYYHDLDLKLVSQFKNTRAHNVTTVQRNSLSSGLNSAHIGLHVFDSDLGLTFYWEGTQWTNGVPVIAGAMTFRGSYTSLTTTPANKQAGDTYVYTGVKGDITWTDQTISPNATVENGDMLVYRGDDEWDVVQGNNIRATTEVSGTVRLSSDAAAIAGENATDAVTASNLKAVIDSKKLPRVFFNAAVTLEANVAFTVAHNLGLQHKDAFTSRVADTSGSDVSVDIDSVDVNSITLTSAIAATGIKVTVIGF